MMKRWLWLILFLIAGIGLTIGLLAVPKPVSGQPDLGTSRLLIEASGQLVSTDVVTITAPDLSDSGIRVEFPPDDGRWIVRYVILVSNTGTLSASVTLTDALPASLQYVSGTLEHNISSGWLTFTGSVLQGQMNIEPGGAFRIAFLARREALCMTVTNTLELRDQVRVYALKPAVSRHICLFPIFKNYSPPVSGRVVDIPLQSSLSWYSSSQRSWEEAAAGNNLQSSSYVLGIQRTRLQSPITYWLQTRALLEFSVPYTRIISASLVLTVDPRQVQGLPDASFGVYRGTVSVPMTDPAAWNGWNELLSPIVTGNISRAEQLVIPLTMTDMAGTVRFVLVPYPASAPNATYAIWFYKEQAKLRITVP